MILFVVTVVIIYVLWQLEQQQSEKVAEAEKNDKAEASVVELMKSKASFLLRFAGCVSVQSRVEVIPVTHYTAQCNKCFSLECTRIQVVA